ncbi:MAG: hypothetical protein R2939_17820 [Kofleriaceae bacterium]
MKPSPTPSTPRGGYRWSSRRGSWPAPPTGAPSGCPSWGKLERGSLGYTLGYTYDIKQLIVSWATDADSRIQLAGEARFLPLSPRACMLVYRLSIELPIVAEWADSSYEGHPASAVVADFREHLKRMG